MKESLQICGGGEISNVVGIVRDLDLGCTTRGLESVVSVHNNT